MRKIDLIKLPKMHFACTNDEIRPIMQHILVTKDEIVASDGHIVAVLKTDNTFPLEFIEQMPDRYLIHKEQWKLLSKGFMQIEFDVESNIIKVWDKYSNIGLINIAIEDELKSYPDYKKVIGVFKKGDVESIGISSRLLYNLGRAIDSIDTIELNFDEPVKGIKVKGVNGAYGLIMPNIITDL